MKKYPEICVKKIKWTTCLQDKETVSKQSKHLYSLNARSSEVRLRSTSCNFKCCWNYIKNMWSSFWEKQSRRKGASWKWRRDIARCMEKWTTAIRSAASTRTWWKTWEKNRREPSSLVKSKFSSMRRAQGRWVATLLCETQLNKLRRKNDDFRQIPVNVQFKSNPFPSEDFAPEAPRAARRGPEVPGHHLGPSGTREVVLGRLEDWGSHGDLIHLSQKLGPNTCHHGKT